MKKVLLILLVMFVGLNIVGCNKNTNYTTAVPYFKYDLHDYWWSTDIYYKLEKAPGLTTKIENGLIKRGYYKYEHNSNCYLKKEKHNDINSQKFICIWHKVNTLSKIVDFRFEIEAYCPATTSGYGGRYADVFDKLYLDIMKDIDETIVQIRD